MLFSVLAIVLHNFIHDEPIKHAHETSEQRDTKWIRKIISR